jgi:hypothetical protein
MLALLKAIVIYFLLMCIYFLRLTKGKSHLILKFAYTLPMALINAA